MNIEITVSDYSEKDRENLRAVAVDLMSKGLMKVLKIPDSDTQEWSFPRVCVAPVCYVRITFGNTDVSKVSKVVQDKQDYNKVLNESGQNLILVNESQKDGENLDHRNPASEHLSAIAKISQTDFMKGTVSIRDEVKEFFDTWNGKIYLNKLKTTDRQCKIIRVALARPAFAQNWRDAIIEIAKSKFLRGAKVTGDNVPFKLTIDWLVEPDNFDKIIEGKYRDQETIEKPTKEKQYAEKKYEDGQW